MALLTAATAKVIEATKAVSYSVTTVYGTWESVEGVSTKTYHTALAYTRTASMSYRYVGLTEDAANAKAIALREQFSFKRRRSVWNPEAAEFQQESSDDTSPMAEVSAVHVEGAMYEVRVEVRESDSLIRRMPIDAKALFSNEEARVYPA
jgi:hypothetical protein